MTPRIELLLLSAPVLLFSMVAHEYAHGWAALRQGDPTAWSLGRLTWNPVKHIDPFMTVILPIMLGLAGAPILGGAKPIPVNPRNYRNLRRGDIIVSLAGVTANLLVALACIPVIVIAGFLGDLLPAVARPLALLQRMAEIGIFLNLVLVVFNLLPIPPLDGSHVFKWLLPPTLANAYVRLAGAGVLVLVAILYFVPQVSSFVVAPAEFVLAAAQRVYFSFLLPNPLS
ncbi:MAG: site-2 protease family protein [Gemmatimonadaceae bacterium]|nr:site-2 protease family protein [Gemmatimonadaceae bacterium]